MTLAVWVVAGAVALVLAGFLLRRSFAGLPDDAGPAAGWHRCRACHGAGSVPDPTTKTGYGLCPPCNGTGWSNL